MTVNIHVEPKLHWRVARVMDSEPETESAQTIGLAVPGWGGHLAGQHIDLRLTAEDGYSAQRSYSLSRPADGERIELTVQQIADGEVSPYLMGVRPGEEIELRGPIGGWFVWRPGDETRILLVAGGSGIVPLMAMLRQRTMVGGSLWSTPGRPRRRPPGRPAASAPVISQCRGGRPTTTYASTSAAQRDSWNR
jgi:hypothetical protein